MKKFTLLCAALVAIAVTASTALAGFHNPGNPCGGKQIVNVTYTLTNDFDSGVAGNAWANDTINRHLRVFDLGAGSYCALIGDTGSFMTFAGPSPQNTGTVSAGISGRIKGGYMTTPLTGTLKVNGAPVTHGYLGSFDLKCIDANNCPGAHPSFLSYFSSTGSYDLANWGWNYHTAQNGNWLNAGSGNVGDITGS